MRNGALLYRLLWDLLLPRTQLRSLDTLLGLLFLGPRWRQDALPFLTVLLLRLRLLLNTLLLLNALLRLPAFLRRRRLLNTLLRRSRLLRSSASLLPRRMLLAPAFILTIILAFVPLRENCIDE